MPLPVDLLDVLGRLDAGTLTRLVLRLLAAEAEDAGLPAEAVTGSERLTIGDDGIDARVDGMPEGGRLPPGTSGFQLKAYNTTAPSAIGLVAELKKNGPRAILSAGGHYVLVWPQQFNERQRQNALKAIRDAARESLTELELDEDRIVDACERLHLFDAISLHQLCAKHEQVVIDLGLAPFSPMRTLHELLVELQSEKRHFEADEQRLAAIDQLRANAREESDRAVIAGMLGLSGTGKTRTCAEALNTEDLSDRVLYASRFDVVSDFLTYAIREQRSSGILLVDEGRVCDA